MHYSLVKAYKGDIDGLSPNEGNSSTGSCKKVYYFILMVYMVILVAFSRLWSIIQLGLG